MVDKIANELNKIIIKERKDAAAQERLRIIQEINRMSTLKYCGDANDFRREIIIRINK